MRRRPGFPAQPLLSHLLKVGSLASSGPRPWPQQILSHAHRMLAQTSLTCFVCLRVSVNVCVSVYTEGCGKVGNRGNQWAQAFSLEISQESSRVLLSKDFRGGAPFRNEIQMTEQVHDTPLPHQHLSWPSHYRGQALISTGFCIPALAGGEGGGEGSLEVARRA